LAPTGNKDPFAQRRAALGLVGNLIAWELDFDLRTALEATAENLPIPASPAAQDECLAFILERLRNVLLDQGYKNDIVDAVVSAQGHNPAKAALAVGELTAWVARADWNTILPAYARCVRITRPVEGLAESTIDPDLLEKESERQLYEVLQAAEATPRQAGSVDDFLQAFLPLIPPIDKFFEDVLVMVEDEPLRLNRLSLLHSIAALADGVADMSRLEGF
jgi:glycyl-tRNA synthetase